MTIIAIDPGCEQSAWVVLRDGLPIRRGKEANADVLFRVRYEFNEQALLAIEAFQSFGMPVGKEVFETCYFVGRLVEAWHGRNGRSQLVYRSEVKLFHCNSAKAKDPNIRQALIDRYGGSKDVAIGRKATPGPLYGIRADEWSALAIALTVEGRTHEAVACP